MSGMIQSESLKCDCGCELFLAAVKLLHSPGGGTSPQPGGYQCQACHAVVDIGYLVKRVKAKHLRAQIAEMEGQLADAPATVGPSPKAVAIDHHATPEPWNAPSSATGAKK